MYSLMYFTVKYTKQEQKILSLSLSRAGQIISSASLAILALAGGKIHLHA